MRINLFQPGCFFHFKFFSSHRSVCTMGNYFSGLETKDANHDSDMRWAASPESGIDYADASLDTPYIYNGLLMRKEDGIVFILSPENDQCCNSRK